MAEQFVGKASEFKDGDRQIVRIGEHEIGIFKHEGEFFAYSNFCLHQGGPSCEGLTIARVEERLSDDKRSMGLHFTNDMNFVCPWHGWEFDIRTGQSWFDPAKVRVKTYEASVQPGTVLVPPAPGLQPGPYQAETYPVSVEESYLVVEV